MFRLLLFLQICTHFDGDACCMLQKSLDAATKDMKMLKDDDHRLTGDRGV